MRFGYRLMRGKQGVSGHARAMGTRAMLSVRGLSPGDSCALYALREHGAEMLETRIADRDGRAQFLSEEEAPLFVAQHHRVVLWEDGPDAEAQYLLASAWVKAEAERKYTAPEPKTAKPEAVASEAVKPEESAPEAAEPEASALEAAEPESKDFEAPGRKANPSIPGEAVSDPPVREQQPERVKPPKRYALRPAGTGEPVDALPILRWPAGTEDLRLNCALRTPFAPFDAPGWRFVRVPSPLPRVPFCAVGYQARDARVKEIAYAIPGPPDRPPVRLAGYHYRPGRHGQGYWVTSKRV